MSGAAKREPIDRRFLVKVRRVVTLYADVEIEAPSVKEAKRRVLDLADDRGIAWSDRHEKPAKVDGVTALGLHQVPPLNNIP